MSIYLKVTNRCNLRCKHCYQSLWHGDMTDEVLFAVIKTFPDDRVIFFGGEPTLAGVDKIIHFASLLKDSNPHRTLSFQSNLFDFNHRFIEVFQRYFNCSVGTSIDTSRIPVWQSIIKNVKLLASENITVTGIITLTEDLTIDTLKRLVEDFLTSGGKYIRLNTVNPVNGCQPVRAEKFYGAFRFLKNYREFENFTLIKRAIQRGSVLMGGNCALRVRVVDPDGSVYPCPDLAGKEQYCLGNLIDGTYLKNRNRIKELQGYRIFFYRQSKLINVCKSSCWSICRGGCTVSALTITGNPMNKDPYCTVIKKIIDEL